MFEKEAEEWAIDYVCKDCSSKECKSKEHCTCKNCSKEKWQNGAEFGYNKANEWHFVKDGDLPKHEVNVLVLYNVQCIDIAHYNYDYKEWHFIDSIVRDVIAWKEIVLPKEN